MNKVLPPGSTSADLQAAIDSAASGDTIIISGDMPFTDTVTIPEGKEITVQSDTGNNWTLSQTVSDSRHFNVSGSLALQDIILDGENIGGGINASSGGEVIAGSGSIIRNCTTTSNGGGINVSNRGSLIMSGGVVSGNTALGRGSGTGTGNGGGIYSGGSVTINNGTISNNTAAYYGGGIGTGYCYTFTMSSGTISNNLAPSGGGIYLFNSSLTMNGGTISGNKADRSAGVYVRGVSSFTMNDGIISGNTSADYGGGVNGYNMATFTMNGGTITRNESSNGGGVYVDASCKLTLNSGMIEGNTGTRGGGGIYTTDMTYSNIITGADTVFRCNRASTAYAPPPDARTLYPDMQFASTTITEHPLNNYDINYAVGDPIDPNFYVTYNANGGSGSYTGPGIAPCETDTVLSPEETGISRPGYTFTGWNTEPDGEGMSFAPGDIVTITGDVTLYAQWVGAPIYTVTYGANGGSGSFVDPGRQYGTAYTIRTTSQAGISRPGFTFTGWNTQPDGSGISLEPGDIITITGDVRLYAQWMENPAPKPRKMCREPVIKCRKNISGQKIWDDNDNKDYKRPDHVEILLLRDKEVYKRTIANSASGWAFGFCCVPVMKNSNHEYDYEIDEIDIPGYTKRIEGYNVTNTYNP